MGVSPSKFFVDGGAVDKSVFKNIIRNGLKFKKKSDLEDTAPYILDSDLSNEYAQVYILYGEHPLNAPSDPNDRHSSSDLAPIVKHVIINHRATDESDKSDLVNLGTYIISENLYKLTTSRVEESKKVQMAAVAKYDMAGYGYALNDDKIPKNKKHLYSIITTIGYSQGAVLAECCGEGSYEIITFNEASKPKSLRALYRNLGLKFESGYTPIVRIRTDGDFASYFNKSSIAVTLPAMDTNKTGIAKMIELHKASNMNIGAYKDKYVGVSNLGDNTELAGYHIEDMRNSKLKVYGVDDNISRRVLHQRRCNIL